MFNRFGVDACLFLSHNSISVLVIFTLHNSISVLVIFTLSILQ